MELGVAQVGTNCWLVLVVVVGAARTGTAAHVGTNWLVVLGMELSVVLTLACAHKGVKPALCIPWGLQ